MKNKLKIGGFTFSVNEVSGLAESGSVSFDKSIILINKEQSDDRKKSALIHEIIETFSEIYNLQLPHQTIQTLEAAIFAFYKDNF
ncbi:MAG TPA: hypothetical protein PKL13_05125 [bacterium]|nr:hypothetical protein [bacterium]